MSEKVEGMGESQNVYEKKFEVTNEVRDINYFHVLGQMYVIYQFSFCRIKTIMAKIYVKLTNINLTSVS